MSSQSRLGTPRIFDAMRFAAARAAPRLGKGARHIAALATTACVLALGGCSRSPLFLGAGVDPGQGSGASSGTGAGGGVDGGADASVPPPPPPCFFGAVREPLAVVEFPEGRADATDLVVLDAGGPTEAARVAYQAISEDANFWHPELRLARLVVGADWPADVALDQSPTLWGFDAHAWGKMSPAVASSDGLALAFFHGDEASGSAAKGFKFRGFDVAAWTPGPEIPIDTSGDVAYALSPGPAVQGAAWGGEGYAVAYRATLDDLSCEPRVLLLDATGTPEMAAVPSAAPRPYPGRGNDVAWTGEHYLVATSFDDCIGGDPHCEPRSMIVTRLQPSGSLQAAAAFATLAPDATPRRPSLTSEGGRTWLAWSEGDPADDLAPRAVRLARLAPDGSPLGAPELLADGAVLSAGIAVAITSAGVVIAWGEPGDTMLPPGEPGHARLIVHHRHLDGASIQPPVELPVTAFAYAPGVTAAALDEPRSVLLGWAAEAESGGPSVGWLARIDCSAAP